MDGPAHRTRSARRRLMKGNPKVVAQLNNALREELTAINQYFLHAEMCHKWGYHRLGALIKKSSIDEMKHAEKLIERLLFLDAVPKMDYLELSIGQDVKGLLTADHKLEVNAVKMYNKAVQISREEGDDTSRELFSLLLKDEEEHVEWLESQLHQMKELGYETYLSNQTEGEKG
jgi:bacterioferritin